MNNRKFMYKMIGMLVVMVSLAGCLRPAATPTLVSTLPVFPSSTLPLPPTSTVPLPPSPTLLLPLTPTQTVQPSGPLFTLVQTVQVTQDEKFLIGGFARVNYVPATDRLVVVFGTQLAQPSGGCAGKGHAYKEYTLDMQPTGNSGVLNCEVADSGGVMVDNTYYDVSMHREGDLIGWRIVKYDAVTWLSLADIFFPLDSPREGDGDPMVAFVNGQLDVSSGYTTYGGPPPPDTGAFTHHQFFSPDLEFLKKEILSDTPHIGGSSLIYVDGIYYYVTATAYSGDLIMMKYDQNWQYLGMKELIKQAHWSTGATFDGQHFYVTYLDTRQRSQPGFFPYYPNVHLVAFDLEWNLLYDVAVTDYAPSDHRMVGRPWVLLHGNQLYVSYDMAPTDPETGNDLLDQIEAFVSIYELSSVTPTQAEQPTSQPTQPAGQSSLFKFTGTTAVTPDANFLTGGTGYIHYVPATDQFVVTLVSKVAAPMNGCPDKVNGYKVLTTDLQPTGEYGIFSCATADMTSTMVENILYVVNMKAVPGQWVGWHLAKYDAVSWKLLADIDVPLDYPIEEDGGMTVALVNGLLDVTGEYNLDEGTHSPDSGDATHHHFFSTDLVSQDVRILDDTLHKPEGSMLYVDGTYYYVASDSMWGNMIVLMYDQNWQYLGTKILRQQANFPTGVVYDDQFFYVAYMDTSQRTDPGILPVYNNIHLAAYDRDWNLVEDIAVTDFSRTDNQQAGSPYIMLHDQKLYVSYTVDEMNPVTHAEYLKSQVYINVYELTQAAGR